MTAIKIIFKDCQPYLKEMRKNRADHFFYRGTRKRGDAITEIKPRQDRYPKDTPQDVQDYIDDFFQKKFGWRPRSQGVFTSYKDDDAKNYGSVHMFFPKGKYEYVFSPDVQDLWSYIDDNGFMQYIEDEPDHWYNDYENEWLDKYDEDSGNGTWYYEGESTGESNKTEALDAAAEAEGTIDLEDEDGYYEIESKLEWVPDITLEDYQEERWNEEREEKMSEFKETLNSFVQSKKLDKALEDGWGAPEVIWKCKSYYIVPVDFEDFFIDTFLKSKNKEFINTIETVDKQMLLPFKWSKKR